jgi:hypothetical protein
VRRARLARAGAAAALAVSAIALGACGGEATHTVTVTSSAPPATAPGTTATTGTTGMPPAPTTIGPTGTTGSRVTRIVRLEAFQTPSGNIGCMMDATGARCEIRRRSWSPPPRPADCPLDWGRSMHVQASGRAGFVCAGDTVLDPAAPVLPYGVASQLGPMSCASQRDGMYCSNGDAHGFTIARQGYREF